MKHMVRPRSPLQLHVPGWNDLRLTIPDTRPHRVVLLNCIAKISSIIYTRSYILPHRPSLDCGQSYETLLQPAIESLKHRGRARRGIMSTTAQQIVRRAQLYGRLPCTFEQRFVKWCGGVAYQNPGYINNISQPTCEGHAVGSSAITSISLHVSIKNHLLQIQLTEYPSPWIIHALSREIAFSQRRQHCLRPRRLGHNQQETRSSREHRHDPES
jgi:hypothetical protein